MQKRAIALILLGVFTLSGCGQTGALYMPKTDKTDVTTTVGATNTVETTDTVDATKKTNVEK